MEQPYFRKILNGGDGVKSLLYKNFVSSKAMLLSFWAIFIVSGVLKILQGEFLDSIGFTLPFSVDIYMVYAVFIIVINISGSDKSSWESYARALPCKVYQRVGARYLFCLILFISVFLAFSLYSVATRQPWRSADFGYAMASWARTELPTYLGYILTFVFSTSFVLLISYAMKQSAIRRLIMGAVYIPPFFALMSIVLTDVLGGYNSLTKTVLTVEFMIMFAAVSVLFYAASFCFSVMLETKSEKEKLKPVRSLAAVLTALAVAFSGVAVGYLYKKGAFIKNADSLWDAMDKNDEFLDSFNEIEPVPSVSYDYGEMEQKKRERHDVFARPMMMDVVDILCGTTLVDKKYDEARDFFVGAGYEEYLYEGGNRNEMFEILIVENRNEKGNFTVVISADVLPAVITYPDSYESNDDAAKKHAEIMELFHVGATEKEAVERMKELGICPYEISEMSDGGVPMRTYSFKVEYFSEYKNAKKPAVMIDFEVVNGRITQVE